MRGRKPSQSSLVVPGEPSFRVFSCFPAVALEFIEIFEWILSCLYRRLNHGHQNVTDSGSMEGFVKETGLSVEHAGLYGSLDGIRRERSTGDLKKEREFVPPFFHVFYRFSERAIGLGLLVFKLVAAKFFERLDEWPTFFLMEFQSFIVIQPFFLGDSVKMKDLGKDVDDVPDLLGKLIGEIDEIASCMSVIQSTR